MPRKNKDDEFNKHDRRHEGSSLAVTQTAELALQERSQADRDLSNQMLGAAMYATDLNGRTRGDQMQFLILVRDQKRFTDYGFASHDDFLNSPISPISSSTFYRELELYEKEGEQYNLLNEWKVPARIRRQLTSGDIAIDGDEIVVAGQERISLTNGGSIKAILEQLVKEKIKAEKTAVEAKEKLGKAEWKGELAKDEIERLKWERDTLKAGTPYEQTLKEAVYALLLLTEKIGQLPDAEKLEKGEVALPQLSDALDRIRTSFAIGKK